MVIPKGYKQTEIGVIPEDWDIEPIKRLATITTGAKNTQDNVSDGLYPFFVRSQTIERINSYSYIGEAVLTAGDGVGTGKVFHYINGKFDFHQRVYKISDFSDRINGYFFFLYFSSNFYNRIMQMTAKSSVDSVRMEMIAEMQIPVPTQSEQTSISAIVSDTDSLIVSLDKLISKKKAIKQGTMQQLLTGKMRLTGFSGKWQHKKLGELFSFSGGHTASRDQLSEDGFCYLHYGDIHGAKKTYIDVGTEYSMIPKLQILLSKVSRKSMLNDGDVVFVDASEDDEGTSRHLLVKNPKSIPYISGLHTIVAKSKDNSLDSGFKKYCFQATTVKNQFIFYAVGTKVSGISKTNIAKIEIRYPGIEEQVAIAGILSDMDAEIESLERKRKKYVLVKRGMMQQLLTGKIRII